MSHGASGLGGRVLPPERLNNRHDGSLFQNGKRPSLDTWLKNRALSSEGLSARTYVVCNKKAPTQVVGYYAISTAMEERLALPSAKLRKGMPDRVPLLLIGRLAVDAAFQGIGLGTDLLVDALRRCLATSEIAGARAIIALAVDDDAVRFYRQHGFSVSPLGDRVMLISIETIRSIFED